MVKVVTRMNSEGGEVVRKTNGEAYARADGLHSERLSAQLQYMEQHEPALDRKYKETLWQLTEAHFELEEGKTAFLVFLSPCNSLFG